MPPAAAHRSCVSPPRRSTPLPGPLGVLVKDVVLTSEEITRTDQWLLISQQPPQGKIAFTTWITEHEIGHTYANEVKRHFTLNTTA